jgi:hypothetical protein
VERPFRDLKERFLQECQATGAPKSIAELNDRATSWLQSRVHTRMHRGIGEVPADRFVIEAPMLQALPPKRFDTAYVEPRRVHVAIPQVEWRGVRYSVPARCLGQRVEVRQEVDSETLEIRWAAELVATHTICDAGEIWDQAHYEEAKQAALGRSRRGHLALVFLKEPAKIDPVRLDIEGDVEVEVPDLSRYETGSEQ